MPEAFEVAGLPDRFPELLEEGLPPWQPYKLYCTLKQQKGNQSLTVPGGNVTGRRNPDLEQDGVLGINSGQFDSLFGRTYQELAWTAYNRHQTQGIGILPSAGDFYYYYRLVRGRMAPPAFETDPFCGLDPTLTGLADYAESSQLGRALEEIKILIDQALAAFRPDDPLPAAWPLLKGLAEFGPLKRKLFSWNLAPLTRQALNLSLERKEQEFQDVIAACLGLRLEAFSTRRRVTPGESFWMSARLWNQRDISLEKTSFEVMASDDWQIEKAEDLNAEQGTVATMASYEVFIGQEAELSCPYWLRSSDHRYLYGQARHGAPQQPLDPPPIQTQCRLQIEGQELTLSTPVVHRRAFAGGTSELPPSVIPPISLHPDLKETFCLVSSGERQLQLKVTARCNDEEQSAEGSLELIVPEQWQVSPGEHLVRLNPLGGAQTCAFAVTIPAGTAEGHYCLRYRILCRGRRYGDVMLPVRLGTPGLPDAENAATCLKEEFILDPARVTVHLIEAIMADNRRYAYVEGTGDEELPPLLKTLGLDFQCLTNQEIAHGDLNSFDAVVIGPRAYGLRAILQENSHRFLEYVEKGGRLIVQYQWFGYDLAGYAPHPFAYRRPMDRVTDEKAPVEIVRPEDPLFHLPNPIKTEDFDGWVHDRGLGFPAQWSPQYQTYLSCSDPGEGTLEGGMIGCRHGQGLFLYLGYSLFRQLPAGVPGAFRLFFNLLAAE